MEPSYGKSGSKGTIRVWNKTNGYLDVSEEGHLLTGQTAAWVEETDEIVALIDAGLLEVLEGQLSKVSSAQSDENSKKKEVFTYNRSAAPQFRHRRSSCCG